MTEPNLTAPPPAAQTTVQPPPQASTASTTAGQQASPPRTLAELVGSKRKGRDVALDAIRFLTDLPFDGEAFKQFNGGNVVTMTLDNALGYCERMRDLPEIRRAATAEFPAHHDTALSSILVRAVVMADAVTKGVNRKREPKDICRCPISDRQVSSANRDHRTLAIQGAPNTAPNFVGVAWYQTELVNLLRKIEMIEAQGKSPAKVHPALEPNTASASLAPAQMGQSPNSRAKSR